MQTGKEMFNAICETLGLQPKNVASLKVTVNAGKDLKVAYDEYKLDSAGKRILIVGSTKPSVETKVQTIDWQPE